MQLVKVSISQQVIEFFSASISGKSWKIGEKIPSENALTRELGVSRSSIRAAIQHFIAIGVLDSVHGKGTFLKSDQLHALNRNMAGIGEEECRDMMKVLEFRLIVEPRGCYLAVERGGKALAARLAEHLRAMRDNAGQPAKFVDNDLQFHLEISKAADNPLLHKSLRETFSQTHQRIMRTVELLGPEDGIHYHTLITRAFERRDPQTAGDLMAEHLQKALGQLR